MGLRWRLNLMIAAVAFAIVLFGMVLVVFNARVSVAEELDSTLNLALELLAVELAATRLPPETPGAWQQRIERLGDVRHLSISLGSADSLGQDDPRIGVPADPQGVPVWFVWSVAPDRYVARSLVSNAAGQQIGVVVQADPADEIREAWREAVSFFVLVVALAGTVSLLVFYTVGRAFRPVSVILLGLEKLEGGDYSERLPDFPLPEFTRISRAINHAAEVLEAAGKKDRSLSERDLAVREQERRFIARELHDEFGQSLSAIQAVSASLKPVLPEGSASASLNTINSTCNRMFAVLRDLMRRLHPLVLEDLGLGAALDDMVERWIADNTQVKVDYSRHPAAERIRMNDQIHVYRIVQECLTNIVRHARANVVVIRVQPVAAGNSSVGAGSTPGLLVEVSDNGCGFDPDDVTGAGLRNLHSRAGALGAVLGLESRAGAGTRIRVVLPIEGGEES